MQLVISMVMYLVHCSVRGDIGPVKPAHMVFVFSDDQSFLSRFG